MAILVDVILTWLMRGLAVVCRRIPLEMTLTLGRFFGRVVSYFHRRRKVAYVNLKAAFGTRYSAQERNVIVRNVFSNLAQNAVETFRFPQLDQSYQDRYVAVAHPEWCKEATRRYRGTIFLTPHFGNWELSQIISGLLGTPLHVLARRQKYSRLNDFLDELRISHGAVAVHKEGGIRNFIRVLQKKEATGALGDLSGGRQGSVIRFFGRLVTAPSGIFEIARRTGSEISPVFIVREKGSFHRMFFEPPFPFVQTSNSHQDLVQTIQNYYRLLESWIERYPDQWFWIYKRWKYCFTKRILVLRDEKAGHRSQAEAVAAHFKGLEKALNGRYEFEYQFVDVRFKSRFHQRLFFAAAFFLYPFVQSRLAWLKWFLEPECAQKLIEAHADFTVSAGSALLPLNLWLKHENLAKSVVVMTPPFPYRYRLFDLLIVPMHDRLHGKLPNTVRTSIAPNLMSPEFLQTSAEAFRRESKFEANGHAKRRIGILIGGSSKSYRLASGPFRRWLRLLKDCASEFHFDFIVTTSRRTDAEISALLKEEIAGHPSCQLLVIANEKNFEHATAGILALSDAVLITEESISMISEALSAGKKVLALQLGNHRLSAKHKRFHEALRKQNLIRFADATNFRSQLSILNGAGQADVNEQESLRIREALKRIL